MLLVSFHHDVHVSIRNTIVSIDRRWFVSHVSITTNAGVSDIQLFGVHGPTPTSLDWWNRTLQTWHSHLTQDIGMIILGDMNIHMSPLDTIGHYTAAHRTCSERFQSFSTTCRVFDAYRILHPDTPGYTFHTHYTATRIDYAWICNSLRPSLLRCEHQPIDIIDHHAVVVILTLTSPLQTVPDAAHRPRSVPGWVFNHPTLREPVSE